jgi:hypothetical protein
MKAHEVAPAFTRMCRIGTQVCGGRGAGRA